MAGYAFANPSYTLMPLCVIAEPYAYRKSLSSLNFDFLCHVNTLVSPRHRYPHTEGNMNMQQGTWPQSSDHPDIQKLLKTLTQIRHEMLDDVQQAAGRLTKIHPTYQASARNLLHYLTLRRRDLRPLQLQLAELGLSSLGRAEAHVLATVDALLVALQALAGQRGEPSANEADVTFARGTQLLAEHTLGLLGETNRARGVRIMVTMPGEAATDYTLIHNLMQQGMDCMRINCAHDNQATWLEMIKHLRRAEAALGRSCPVAMDLAGPKLRTGQIQAGPAVVKIRPQRDSLGRVIAPARVWLCAQNASAAPPSPATASLPVDGDWLAQLDVGSHVTFEDSRKSARRMVVVDITERGCWAELMQTAYVTPGTLLQHGHKWVAPVGDLPCLESAITLRQGDNLIVTRELTLGRPAVYDSAGTILTPASIGCSIPEIFDDVTSGESIWFDDGKIGGIIENVGASEMMVRITQVRSQGEKLRADKGINLPDTQLNLPSLTAKDIADLTFAAAQADIIEMSFVNSASDVESLQTLLVQDFGQAPGIVLKIETRRGFANLPDMLLTAMRSPRCGVMIARGDLAVECGFERMAEVQEEILWMCEAAHVPVIWATQVLETLAKDGMPSRAEITDAAMGDRAECVMLNKGPYILSAVRVLDDILTRMQAHQSKKRPMLRELQLAHRLPQSPSV